MPKRDIYRLSESEQPKTLFRKPRKHPLMSPWLWLVLVIFATAALDLIGLINVSSLVEYVLG